MIQSIPGILRIDDPVAGTALPVLVDSPHSGRIYPADFAFTCQKSNLERYEDRYVDQLVIPLTKSGATVITAEVARSYIDLNRAHDDISPRLIGDAWVGPFALNPTSYSERGVGLIWERAENVILYKQVPGSTEVLNRINTCYNPYYAALNDRAGLLKARFGRFVHLNIHSMPPHINNGQTDIVLGDLGGASCHRVFRDLIKSVFENAGLRVAINAPYRGARLTELFGHPQRRQESMQIELSKALYLKRDLLRRDDAKFEKLQEVLTRVVAAAGLYANTASNEDMSAASSSAIVTSTPSELSDATP